MLEFAITTNKAVSSQKKTTNTV